MITRSADHHYTYEGKTYPGVTSILKVLDKSGPLMHWAARQTAEAAVAQAASLPKLVEDVGPEGAIKALTSRSSWKRDEAASIGIKVHDYADRLHTGEEQPFLVDPAVVDRVAHYQAWLLNCGWKINVTEAMIVHTQLGYGGTLDILATDADGRRVLADIKTGKGVYNETALQLAAYGGGEVIQVNGRVLKMKRPDRYVILHVTREGVREVEVPVGAHESIAFANCLELYHWNESVKGRKL